MISLLRGEALQRGAPLVATVGRLLVAPNVPNVVPGEVSFTVDARHTDAEALNGFCGWFRSAFGEAATSRGLTFQCEEWFREEPAPMDDKLKDSLEEICVDLGMSWRRMVSGAGHDAQMFQRLTTELKPSCFGGSESNGAC